jgi:hypothetical protein
MNAALQLNVEQTLATFFAAQNITGFAAANIFPAHAKNKVPPDTRGIYVGVIADPPEWEDGVIFATLNLTFELATGGVDDHDRAPGLTADHQTRVAAVIELFSQQKYDVTKAALNAISAALQFIGWEQDKAGIDGTADEGKQLITRLTYAFDVFLTA